MVLRCWFITSSYSSRCLRMVKLCPSTCFWAASIRLLNFCLNLIKRLLPLLLCCGGGINSFLAQLFFGRKLCVATQQNIRPAASHIGSNGDRTLAPCLGNDLGFLFVIFGVEHHMLDP